MATPFSVELSVGESPSEAQGRAATALVEPARSLGLRLTDRGADELTFKPRIGFPLFLTLWRNLNREHMTVKFAPDPGGGTRVTLTGAVSGGRKTLASDPELWTEALGGSPVKQA
jgi:hypothetical protein